MLLHLELALLMGLVKSGWIMFSAVVMRLNFLTAVLIHWEATIVIILMMLVYDALELLVPGVMFDFKVAMQLKAVWRYASTMSGAQYVMTSGVLQKLKLCAGSWDFQVL